MPAEDHTVEIAALHRRFPRWSIWFGLATGHWWALPPADRDIGDFVEATTSQKLIASIEVIQQTANHTDSRQGIRRPSASLHLEGVTATRPVGYRRQRGQAARQGDPLSQPGHGAGAAAVPG